MGLRFIPYYEVDENSPDSTYLAAGLRENLVEGMKSWSALNCGHTSYNLGTYYDVNGRARLLGGTTGVLVLQRERIYIPSGIDGIEAAVSGFHDQPYDSNFVWRITLYNYSTATFYHFYTDTAPSTTTNVVLAAGTGIPGGAAYRLLVYAYRYSSVGASVIFTLRGVRLRLYLV